MPGTYPEQALIRLRHGDSGEVCIETEDEDRFLMTVEAVVRACKTYGQITEVGKQVRKLLRKLREWFDNHVDSISEAYLTTRDSGLLFLVVQEDKAFNPSLEDALTDLDLEVANDQENFNLIRLSVLSLPATSEESVRFFLPPFEAE